MKTLIIGFEGLWSFNAGFLRNGLILPTLKKHLVFADFAHDQVDKALNTIRLDDMISPPGTRRLILIGHSYGGHAIQDLLNMGVKADAVITCDPRWRWDPFRRGKFKKPLTMTGPWFNYRQTWQIGLIGYEVQGADLNKNVGLWWHTNVPKVPEIREKLKELLG